MVRKVTVNLCCAYPTFTSILILKVLSVLQRHVETAMFAATFNLVIRVSHYCNERLKFFNEKSGIKYLFTETSISGSADVPYVFVIIETCKGFTCANTKLNETNYNCFTIVTISLHNF